MPPASTGRAGSTSCSGSWSRSHGRGSSRSRSSWRSSPGTTSGARWCSSRGRMSSPRQLALSRFSTFYATDQGLTFAGMAIVILPPLVLFLVLQRRFIQGLTTGAIRR